MKFYIVDDDVNIVRILTSLIEEKGAYEVVGTAGNGEDALHDILSLRPDIVLADLLMPVMDGTELVKRVKEIRPNLRFIMISQVLDEELRSEAYEAGIEFFISKPINRIEVKNVIGRVAEKLEMEEMLFNIKRVFKDTSQPALPRRDADVIFRLKHVLGQLGMLGEKGTTDILEVSLYLIQNQKSFGECDAAGLQDCVGGNPQIVRQRMRRAIKGGLTNLANLGVEDYGNDIFQNYAGILFDYSSVRAEMDCVSGKRLTGGKISLSKFFEGLLLKCGEE